jgi:D-cysteine desulfhydrase
VQFNDTGFYIKRDDMTGVELTGNKVRKLEYLLYRAKKIKADYIFTCGGDQSNHCRATVLAALSVGIKTRLFLWGSDRKLPDSNLFIDKLVNAEVEYLNWKEYQRVNEIMDERAKMLAKKGLKADVIPTGGSNKLGIWGYINFVDELAAQIDLNKLSGIILPVGSGGTAAGLLLGLAMRGSRIKVYGVNVFPDAELFRQIIFDIIRECRREYKIKAEVDESRLVMLDGYSTEGYKKISPDKVKVIRQFAEQTGIILDPAYTGKAFYAYSENFLKNRKRSNILFLHTGGIFGVFAKRKEYLS